MPKRSASLDDVFQALANPTRRDVVARLVRGPAAMTELAGDYEMALPSFLQHLKVLEACGLVRSVKRGRKRIFELQPEALTKAESWFDKQRTNWEKRLDQLDQFLMDQKESK